MMLQPVRIPSPIQHVQQPSLATISCNQCAIIGRPTCIIRAASARHKAGDHAALHSKCAGHRAATRRDRVAERAQSRADVGASAAVYPPIRSTTRFNLPPSICTRRLDGFATDGITSMRWPEQVQQEATARGGGRRRRVIGREEGRPCPRPDSIFLQSSCTRKLMDLARTATPRRGGRSKSGKRRRRVEEPTAARGREACGGGRPRVVVEASTCVTLNGSGIQLAVGPQPLRLRNHNFGLAQRIMVKRLATSPLDPLGITDSACKNQLVVVSVQYGPFNTYIPIRSTTIGKSRVAIDPIVMHTSWRSNSDITSVTSIGYPRTRASGESSTTKHRLLHASGPHPIPPPNDPKRVEKRVKVRRLSCRVSMTFRVVRTNQYNQDLGLIHSTNGNHLESPNEGSSIDHQVTIHLHAQNITMFPTNDMVLHIADASLKLGRPYPHFDGPID
ncbi:hypothetical protein F511_32981 [Dorcoceras hygrometricum]|uniref:Uncharacterized protein n=1 Tax=Dorcoceras hygrometricum TaxID=472368 RepID=A0A2Z7BW82_9LAMI|nr:hypothetical protein F511_32981 [Dorcoceras hygrometricum]